MNRDADAQLADTFATISPKLVRNVCVVAHVDHGKTTLADSLVSANALISQRMAGKMRYLDSRPDEQRRGITMKSSAVSLLVDPLLVNLVDSPGHVDFASEVQAGLLLADAALLLVDAVEGVCPQTRSLLRAAIESRLGVVLVVNKVDRLQIEYKMTPAEAHQALVRLLEKVNSCVAQVLAGLVVDDEAAWTNLEQIEEQLHFEPAKGNVIFASALHLYGFTLADFAKTYSARLQIDESTLTAHLFGDFYLAKGGAIKPGAFAAGKRTLFDSLVLDALWKLHDAALVKKDFPEFERLAGTLGHKYRARSLVDAFDEVMAGWLPLSSAFFKAIARQPSAEKAFQNEDRLKLIARGPDNALWSLVQACDPTSDVTLLYAAKLVYAEEQQVALCRIFSGTLRAGDEVYVLNDDEEGSEGKERRKLVIRQLYVVRGREYVAVRKALAGLIVGVAADGLMANMTLSSRSEGFPEPLALKRERVEPLVRVSLRPTAEGAAGQEKLRSHLKLLAQLDTALRVLELETGELAIVTAGEVHLQKCLADLAQLGHDKLDVSPPIVPFMETLVASGGGKEADFVECALRTEAGSTVRMKVRAVPIGDDVLKVLLAGTDQIAERRHGGGGRISSGQGGLNSLREKLLTAAKQSWPSMKGTYFFRRTPEQIERSIAAVWAFGPARAQHNLLIVQDRPETAVWNANAPKSALERALLAGFELFAAAGPLCEEPLQGVAIVVDDWTTSEEEDGGGAPSSENDQPSMSGVALTGQAISAFRQACRSATEKHSAGQRLVAAMYRCRVATDAQTLGAVHAVLAQRQAKVTSEDMNEATGLFEIDALMPVVESFSFCEQLRKKTSGLASAQLEFSHWATIDEDPLWEPSTQEEIEHFGVKADSVSAARRYMDAVRRRKGLATADQLVESAEKQRTLAKKK